MEILKLSQKFEKLLIQASYSTYQELVNIHNLAQGLAVDPYSEMSEEEKKQINELVRSTAILADRAYQKGLSAEDLKFSVEKLKNKIMNLGMNPNFKSSWPELNSMIRKLQTMTFVDIPSQKPVTNPVIDLDLEPDNLMTGQTVDPNQPLVTPEMNQVVHNLVNQSHNPDSDVWPE